MDIQTINQTARQARRYVVTMNHKAGKGHTGADLSEIDIICTLYMAVMDRSQARPDQDRFILSKGHGAGGFYCSCAAMGLLDPAVLDQYMGDDTLLAGHPIHQKLPELVEINSGVWGMACRLPSDWHWVTSWRAELIAVPLYCLGMVNWRRVLTGKLPCPPANSNWIT